MADVSNAKKEFADSIDTDVIAETVFDMLEDEEISLTSENARKVWLDVLYTEMGDAVSRSVNALADKGDFNGESADVQLPEKIGNDGSIAK